MVGIELKRKGDVTVGCRCRWGVEGEEIGLNLHLNEGSVTILKSYIVGNKAKGRISKRVFRENANQGVRNVFCLITDDISYFYNR